MITLLRKTRTKKTRRTIVGCYVSSDEVEIAEAHERGGVTIAQHPNQVPLLFQNEDCIVDFDHLLFDDKAAGVALISRALATGMTVGVHTYDPDQSKLDEFRGHPRFVIGKTQHAVRVKIANL